MEREIRHQNFLSDSALDLTKAGYWHVPLDGSGWYNSSERAARIFGDLPSPGHRYRSTIGPRTSGRATRRRPRLTTANFAAAVRGRIPSTTPSTPTSGPWTGASSGSTRSATSRRTRDGKPSDMFGVTQDITDFKLLEADLIAAKETAEEATRPRPTSWPT